MKNRTILGILCIVLAIAVMFGVAPIVNKLSASKITIARVAMDVPKGHQITDKDVETVTVGGFNLPKDIVKDIKTVIGKYAACDLKAEDYILPAKIKETADNSDDIFRTLDGNELAMSIAIPSFAGGLSGKLQNGDIVSVLVADKDEAKGIIIPPELKWVKVITTTTATGNDRNEPIAKEDGTVELPSTVTLLVNTTQAKLLAQANGNIYIVLVFRGDEAMANKFLELQKEVFRNE